MSRSPKAVAAASLLLFSVSSCSIECGTSSGQRRGRKLETTGPRPGATVNVPNLSTSKGSPSTSPGFDDDEGGFYRPMAADKGEWKRLSEPHRKAVSILLKGHDRLVFDVLSKPSGKDIDSVAAPFAVTEALLSALSAARGKTLEEMMEALVLPKTLDEVGAARATLLALLRSDLKDLAAQMGEAALWVSKKTEIRDQNKSARDKKGGLAARTTGFAEDPDAARKEINRWAGGAAGAGMEDLLPKGSVTAGTQMVLGVLASFEGLLKGPFLKSRMEKAQFLLPGCRRSKLELMIAPPRTLQYRRTDDMEMIDLPVHGGKSSMIVILPKTADGIYELQSKLKPGELAEWIAGMAPRTVQVAIPRMKMGCGRNLASLLVARGMKQAFEKEADFSGLLKRAAKLDSFVHRVSLTMDKQGTKIPSVKKEDGAGEKPIAFLVDRPFLFLIRHRATGVVMFAGRILHPTKAPIEKIKGCVAKVAQEGDKKLIPTEKERRSWRRATHFPGDIRVSGGLEAEDVGPSFHLDRKAIRKCVTDLPERQKRKLGMSVKVSFAITTSGQLKHLSAMGLSGHTDSSVSECLTRLSKRWAFPKNNTEPTLGWFRIYTVKRRPFSPFRFYRRSPFKARKPRKGRRWL